ncbi:MAG: GWxTD domain-containing protein [Clostridiales bacterium]|nr:GWxTD domain-containing protein [Clostridiales bacterium]
MKRAFSSAVILSLFSGALILLPLFPQDILPHHREWLENVGPIMTKTEREIFSKLKTNEERDRFIRFFWRQRDPHPDTEENEFYKEYMERVRFVDQNFGRGTSKRGSMTERGTYYLLLGPPLERHFYTTHSQLWPLELWYYKGEIEYGLPSYFYLIFYQPEGLGEYRLYSPGVEGPEKLVLPTAVSGSLTRTVAFQVIKRISAELANASLSYLPGDQTLQTPAFSSAAVLASIRSVPEKKFSDAYARTYLSYKDYVETEYTHAFIESGFVAKVFGHEGGFFLHWALEPKKMSFADRGERYQAVYGLILRLEDGEGNLVLEKEEEIPLAITPEQYKEHERRAFAFQDILPVVPGRFKLFGLLKNKTAQDFTSFSREIVVPEKAAGFSPLLLYHSREPMPASESRLLRAFTFGGTHYLVNAANEFPPGGVMGAYVQAPGLKGSSSALGVFVLLEIRQAELEEPAFIQKWSLAETLTGEGTGIDTGPVSLVALKPGYYSAEVSLVGKDGKKILSARENFVLLAKALPVLPWVYARGHSPFPNPDHLFLFASQYFMTRKYDEAFKLADQAFALRDEPRTRLLLAKTLHALGRFQDSLEAAMPLYEGELSREAAKIIAACHASLKNWPTALVYLEKLMAEATETSVLNLAGECYVNLNQPARALPLLRRSLEIDPNQPAVKALLEASEKKLNKHEDQRR